jgi:hypothetical protein
VVERLPTWAAQDRLEVVDALTEALAAEEFEANERWAKLLFAELADAGELASASLCRFFKAFVEKAKREHCQVAFEKFCERLRSTESAKVAHAVKCLAMCFEAKPELQAFFEREVLGDEVFQNWPPELLQFRPLFERKPDTAE